MSTRDWLEACAVTEVDTVEEALQRLRASSFDIVVCRASVFIPLQGSYSSGQATAIIDSVTQGICIVRDTGEVDWANPTMVAFADEVRGKVQHFCVETASWAQAKANAGSKHIRSRRFSFTTGHDKFEVTATPVVDAHGRITQVAAVVWDVTNSHRLREQIDAIDQAGRELLSLDAEQVSRLEPQERLALLEQKILRCTRDLLHFDNFEIFVLDKNAHRLEPVLSAGIPGRCGELLAEAEGNGICGYVASRGRSYIFPDTEQDPRYLCGVEGAKSSLTVPLTLHDEVVGVANFESTRPGAFTEDDRQFAEIFGRYVALGLHLLQLLLSERRTAAGRMGTNVLTEITGPVNDILTDVGSLVEDCIGHDDLRKRLQAISENAVRIRESIKALASPKPGVVGCTYQTQQRHDKDLSGRRILLADDEEVIRETVRDVLAGYGCTVRTAADGGTAVDLLANEHFDLVLSDIRMPVKSGYEVFAAAKQADPRTPVILTTGFGYDPNHSIIRARREGLAAVLFKPFKVDQLLGEIRTALQSASEASVAPGKL